MPEKETFCIDYFWGRLIHSIIYIHCGLVTPYVNTDLGQHWLRQWLGAVRHQAITWTNVDFSSVRSSDNHPKAGSQRCLSHQLLKLAWKLLIWFVIKSPQDNDLTQVIWVLVNIGSDYGLMPSGSKTSPEPMLTRVLRQSLQCYFNEYW